MSIETVIHNHTTWANLVRPLPEDVHHLQTLYPHFHPLNLRDCLRDLEFPKIDHHDEYLFIVIQFPYWDERNQIYRPSEVDIFISAHLLVTAHTGVLTPLTSLIGRIQKDDAWRGQLMDQGASALLYEILHELIDYCYPLLQNVNQNIRHIEEHMFQADTEHILHDIAQIRREVIALRHILRPQCDVLENLERGQWPFLQADMALYWSNLGDHLAQLRAMLDEHMDVVNGLSDTIDTLASHRIDGVVRVLTLITILTAPLTLLATVFGINVDLLPAQFHPVLFFGINICGIGLTIALLVYLRRRHWL